MGKRGITWHIQLGQLKLLTTDATLRKIETEVMEMRQGTDGVGVLTASATNSITFSKTDDLEKLMVGSALVVDNVHYYIISISNETTAAINKIVTWAGVSFQYKTWSNKNRRC